MENTNKKKKKKIKFKKPEKIYKKVFILKTNVKINQNLNI